MLKIAQGLHEACHFHQGGQQLGEGEEEERPGRSFNELPFPNGVEGLGLGAAMTNLLRGKKKSKKKKKKKSL